MRTHVITLLAGLSSLSWSRPALACAVCGGDTPEASKMAFIVTTALLTFLPLGMLGGLVYWIRKRVREVEGGLSRATVSPPAPRR